MDTGKYHAVNQGDQEKTAFSPGSGMDGVVPIQKDAIWSMWSLKYIPKADEYCNVEDHAS